MPFVTSSFAPHFAATKCTKYDIMNEIVADTLKIIGWSGGSLEAADVGFSLIYLFFP